jgi:hypothetical protein
MARDFTKNISNYVSLGAGAIGPLLSGASGMSFACWVNQDSQAASDGDEVFTAFHSSSVSIRLGLRNSNLASFSATLRRQNGDTGNFPVGGTTLTTGVWNHVGCCVSFGSNGKVYLNGVNDTASFGSGSAATTAGTFVSSTGVNHDGLGAFFTVAVPTSTARQLDGRLAECALWNVELTAADFASLAKGFTPDQVRPESLVAYWPMTGNASNIAELRNAKNGTITGSIPAADHTRIYS